MAHADTLVAMLCDEVKNLEIDDRMDLTHRVVVRLMEFIAYDIVKSSGSASGTTLFMMASEYDKYLRSARESGGAEASGDDSLVAPPGWSDKL